MIRNKRVNVLKAVERPKGSTWNSVACKLEVFSDMKVYHDVKVGIL